MRRETGRRRPLPARARRPRRADPRPPRCGTVATPRAPFSLVRDRPPSAAARTRRGHRRLRPAPRTRRVEEGAATATAPAPAATRSRNVNQPTKGTCFIFTNRVRPSQIVPLSRAIVQLHCCMQDLTTGSLTGHLLKTTSFMLVSMIFQTLYLVVDLFWVGRLGTDAVAAVGISGNLSFLVLAISQMLGVGTTTVVSHAAGRKEHERATYLFNQSQVLSMVAGVVFLAIAMYYRSAYAAALSGDEGTRLETERFLLWFIPAMALQFAMVAMGAALRGTGNFKP